MSDFVPGLRLCEQFFREHVEPALRGRRYAAALLGPGSEVLGLDTARSTDHDWGARVQVFPDEPAEEVAEALAGLPKTFGGHRVLGVEVADLGEWCVRALGFDARDPVPTARWLATPTQSLASVTTGAVFRDDLGELAALRHNLRWYPTDVWKYVLACQWQRIAEEQPFVGRCGEVGDDVGSAVVAARLVRDVMRLALLAHRVYPPYAKWLGSAFAKLPDADACLPQLRRATTAEHWPEREAAVAAATAWAADLHNRLRLTQPVDATLRHFHDRPFVVLGAERFAAALFAGIADPRLRALGAVGAVDQWTDGVAPTARPDRLYAAQQAMGGA